MRRLWVVPVIAATAIGAVVAANAFPLTPDQETLLQRLLRRAFCDQA